MSSNYSAGQFDDAFAPTRLGNWEVTEKVHSRHPHSPRTSRPTKFIANDKGHLLPGVQKGKSNLWGCLQTRFNSTGIACPCKLTRCLRSPSHASKRGSYPLPSFKRQKRKAVRQNQSNKLRRSDAVADDSYLIYLKELRLPVIWIVGYPTQSIIRLRRQYAKEIARNLNFRYIELQEQLVKWSKRSNQSTNYPSTSTPNPDSECFNSHIGSRIAFDTLERFKTDKILELLKFAMAENLPCEGFVIDCFPCNLDEAQAFERTFYPSAMGILFVAGTVSQIGGNQVKQFKGGSHQPERDPILHPELLRRRHFYTHKDAGKICNVFGRKIIRVIETKDLDTETFGFLLDLIRSNLERYEDLVCGQGKLVCDFGYSSRICSGQSEGYETVPSASSGHTLYNSNTTTFAYPNNTTLFGTPTSPMQYSGTQASYALSILEKNLCTPRLVKAPYNTPCEEIREFNDDLLNDIPKPPTTRLAGGINSNRETSSVFSSVPDETLEDLDDEDSPLSLFAHRSDSEIMKKIFDEIDDAEDEDDALDQQEMESIPLDNRAFGDYQPRVVTPHPRLLMDELQQYNNNNNGAEPMDAFEAWFLEPDNPDFASILEGGDFKVDVPSKKK